MPRGSLTAAASSPLPPKPPEMSPEQLDGVAGGWNNREYMFVYCKNCGKFFFAFDDEELERIVTTPCSRCGAPYTSKILNPYI